MSITDELRKYADDLDNKAAMKSEHGFSPVGMRLGRIADKIDEEHERTYRNLTDALHKQEDATRELDEKSVLLPRDADGKPIMAGDVLTDGKHTYTVTSIAFNSCNVVVYGCTETNKSEWPIYQTNKMRHVERPTVEGTLRELVEHVTPGVEWEDELFAEYADRIREALRDE